MNHWNHLTICVTRFALASLIAAAITARADVATFSTDYDGATRVAAVQTRDVDGVEYVPLLDLVQQFGGGYSLLFSRVQIDIGSYSAYVPFNEREIDASGSRFSLRRPVLRTEENVLIARSDVAVFFQNAFRVAVQLGAGPTVSVPITPRDETPAPGTDIPRGDAPAKVEVDKDRKIRTVILDPGHGGFDRGAVGRSGLQESELSMAVAKTMRDVLGGAGYQVILTREENDNLSIAERVKIANDNGGDLIVSIHGGTSFAPNAHGIEMFYPTLGVEEPGKIGGATYSQPVSRAHPYMERSRQFAQLLAGAVREATAADIRGIHGALLRLHKTVHMPGVLVEIGMLSNQADEALLEQESYRQGIAQGLLKAIEQFNAGTEAS